jgi:hypothetical protein
MLQRITRQTRGISFVVRRHFPVAPMWFHKIWMLISGDKEYSLLFQRLIE